MASMLVPGLVLTIGALLVVGARGNRALINTRSEGQQQQSKARRRLATKCEAGKYIIDEGMVLTVPYVTCDNCVQGRYTNGCGGGRCHTSKSCNMCGMGQYQDGSGQTSCKTCDPGLFSDSPNGAAECKTCPAGYVQPASGSDSCTACSQGRTQENIQVETCVDCAAGFYQSRNGGSGSCLSCIPGRYQHEEGQSDCLSCLEGTYQETEQSTACIDCPRGYDNADIKTFCHICQAGWFGSGVRNIRCQPVLDDLCFNFDRLLTLHFFL